VADSFQCTVVTPEQQVFDDQVKYASIPAWDGLIGLAPSRAPLLAKLGDGALRLDLAGGGSRWFFLAGGYAQMKNNRLTLLTNEALEATEVQAAEAEASLKEAQARVALTDEQVDTKLREVNRARTLKRIVNLADSKA